MVLVFLLLFLSSAANAAICPKILDTDSNPRIRVHGLLNLENKKQVGTVASGVVALLGPQFDWTDSIEIFVKERGTFPEARLTETGHRILFPFEYGEVGNEDFVPSEEMSGIWAHEIGHLAFHVKLLQTLPEEIKRRYMRAFETTLQLEALQVEFNKQKYLRMTSRPVADFRRRSSFREKDLLETLSSHLGDKFLIDSVIVPYAESFSDLVAVAYTQDSKALSAVLNRTQEIFARNRDYSELQSPNNWNREEEHDLFMPTTGLIWQALLKGQVGETGNILNEIMGIIAERIVEELASGEIGEPEDRNLDFILGVQAIFPTTLFPNLQGSDQSP